jgi:hypothetical protein
MLVAAVGVAVVVMAAVKGVVEEAEGGKGGRGRDRGLTGEKQQQQQQQLQTEVGAMELVTVMGEERVIMRVTVRDSLENYY